MRIPLGSLWSRAALSFPGPRQLDDEGDGGGRHARHRATWGSRCRSGTGDDQDGVTSLLITSIPSDALLGFGNRWGLA